MKKKGEPGTYSNPLVIETGEELNALFDRVRSKPQPAIKVYSLEEVADILQLTRRTLYNYIKDGKLQAVKMGKYWRVTEKNLEAFIAKGTEA